MHSIPILKKKIISCLMKHTTMTKILNDFSYKNQYSKIICMAKLNTTVSLIIFPNQEAY